MFDTPTSDPSAGPHARFTLVSQPGDDEEEEDEGGDTVNDDQEDKAERKTMDDGDGNSA